MPHYALGDALVLSPPGLGPITVREARSLNLRAVEVGGDRRADVVGINRPSSVVGDLRTAEDVLVVAQTLPILATAGATAAGLDPRRVVDALTLATASSTHSRRGGGFRVVVRVTDERHFLRTALRGAVERRLGRLDDDRPAADELWIVQTDRRTLHVAVRARAWSRRTTRTVERPGALRPAIAAAMVLCARGPSRVLDPCCGSGTILREVEADGVTAVGGDIDVTAIAAASVNTAATLVHLDARRLPFAGESFDAVITNLPFGRQHQLQGSPVAWYRRALSESLRVAGSVVVLAAPTQPFRQALGRMSADLIERHDVTVLGQRAAIWSLGRPHAPGHANLRG